MVQLLWRDGLGLWFEERVVRVLTASFSSSKTSTSDVSIQLVSVRRLYQVVVVIAISFWILDRLRRSSPPVLILVSSAPATTGSYPCQTCCRCGYPLVSTVVRSDRWNIPEQFPSNSQPSSSPLPTSAPSLSAGERKSRSYTGISDLAWEAI